MVKFSSEEVAPISGGLPKIGAGVKTVIVAVPAVATSAAVRSAAMRVGLIKVVVREEPLIRTTEPCTKPAPSTRSEKPALDSATTDGNSDVCVGTVLATGKSYPSTRKFP